MKQETLTICIIKTTSGTYLEATWLMGDPPVNERESEVSEGYTYIYIRDGSSDDGDGGGTGGDSNGNGGGLDVGDASGGTSGVGDE